MSPQYGQLEAIEAQSEANRFDFVGLDGLAGNGHDFLDPSAGGGDEAGAVHAVASCLKKYFRSLPNRLFANISLSDWDDADATPEAAYSQLENHLDPDSQAVALWLVAFLQEVDCAQAARERGDGDGNTVAGSEGLLVADFAPSLRPTIPQDVATAQGCSVSGVIRAPALSIILSTSLFPDMDVVGMTLELGIGAVQEAVIARSAKQTSFLLALLQQPGRLGGHAGGENGDETTVVAAVAGEFDTMSDFREVHARPTPECDGNDIQCSDNHEECEAGTSDRTHSALAKDDNLGCSED